ncbi:MAG: MASE3 domain-containing protein [bacterium]
MPEPETVYAPYTPSRHSAGTIYAPFAAALLAAWAVARLLAPLWPANAAALHTATEAISIVMSLAIFMVAWLTFDMGSAIPPIVGFGYLAAAIFDAGHAALYPGLPFGATSPEMSVRYWMAARLTEAAVLLLAYGLKIRRPISRCAGLAVTLTASLGISCLLYVFPAAPPLFIADRNATALKIVLELIVIISLLLTVAAVRERPVGAPDDSRCLCLAFVGGSRRMLFHSVYRHGKFLWGLRACFARGTAVLFIPGHLRGRRYLPVPDAPAGEAALPGYL